MKRRMENWQEVFIGTLQRAIETGDCGVMRSLIESGNKLLEEADFEAFRSEYLAIRGKMEAAFRHEAVHGKGSLFAKEHPLNIRIKSMRSAVLQNHPIV